MPQETAAYGRHSRRQTPLGAVLALTCALVAAACSDRRESSAVSNPPSSSKTEPPSNAPRVDRVVPAEVGAIPIYVVPYYYSEGPRIDVGEFSSRLCTQSAAQLRATASKMKTQWADLSVEAMYVASIRLYDLGLRDESVYWFYSAQYRSRLYQSLLCTPDGTGMSSTSYERCHAHNSFHKLAGEYINGYAFQHVDRLLEIMDKINTEGKDIPNLCSIYPNERFVPKGEWQAKNAEVSSGLTSFANDIREKPEEIRVAADKMMKESKIRFEEHLKTINRLIDSGVIDRN